MADLMFRKSDYELATIHFQRLLERRPGKSFPSMGFDSCYHFMVMSMNH